jgi:hypothetical protein
LEKEYFCKRKEWGQQIKGTGPKITKTDPIDNGDRTNFSQKNSPVPKRLKDNRDRPRDNRDRPRDDGD